MKSFIELERSCGNQYFIDLFWGSIALPLWLVLDRSPRRPLPGRKGWAISFGFLLGYVSIDRWWPEFESRNWYSWRICGGLLPVIDPPEGGYIFKIVVDKKSRSMVCPVDLLLAAGVRA